ncbi:hypothetical protein SRHO_G00089920 [Serrasalmus rhombeus]
MRQDPHEERFRPAAPTRRPLLLDHRFVSLIQSSSAEDQQWSPEASSKMCEPCICVEDWSDPIVETS